MNAGFDSEVFSQNRTEHYWEDLFDDESSIHDLSGRWTITETATADGPSVITGRKGAQWTLNALGDVTLTSRNPGFWTGRRCKVLARARVYTADNVPKIVFGLMEATTTPFTAIANGWQLLKAASAATVTAEYDKAGASPVSTAGAVNFPIGRWVELALFLSLSGDGKGTAEYYIDSARTYQYSLTTAGYENTKHCHMVIGFDGAGTVGIDQASLLVQGS